jgi:hypothetical protein
VALQPDDHVGSDFIAKGTSFEIERIVWPTYRVDITPADPIWPFYGMFHS